MGIELKYGANPAVVGAAAFAGGKNKYFQEQQRAWLPMIAQRRQLETQVHLASQRTALDRHRMRLQERSRRDAMELERQGLAQRWAEALQRNQPDIAPPGADLPPPNANAPAPAGGPVGGGHAPADAPPAAIDIPPPGVPREGAAANPEGNLQLGDPRVGMRFPLGATRPTMASTGLTGSLPSLADGFQDEFDRLLREIYQDLSVSDNGGSNGYFG